MKFIKIVGDKDYQFYSTSIENLIDIYDSLVMNETIRSVTIDGFDTCEFPLAKDIRNLWNRESTSVK